MGASSDPHTTGPGELRGHPPKDLPAVVERPRAVGPYRIVHTIGEGPGGVEYLAERPGEPHAKIALKVIGLSVDAREVLARLELERGALALSGDPGIAALLDMGVTVSGRPYLVTEHCPGVSITEYCDLRRLHARERLELFLQVCRSVARAHGRGVLHGAIKPSNIIVSSQGGQPVAKVTDFGIARAVNLRGSELKRLRHPGRTIGTPVYVSPERARGTMDDVDERSDVYSLGVLLYELLVGEPPPAWWRLEQPDAHEMLRRLREKDSAMRGARERRPDRRGTSRRGARVSRRRPVASNGGNDRDVVHIALRAMSGDADQRHASVSELAESIERHLERDEARRRAGIETSRALLRRKRVAAVAIIAILLAGLGGLIAHHALTPRSVEAPDLHAEIDGQRNTTGEPSNSTPEVTSLQPESGDTPAAAHAPEDGAEVTSLGPESGGTRAEARPVETSQLETSPSPRVSAPLESTQPRDGSETLHGWEWRHLVLGRDLSLRALRGHGDRVDCVAFSPDSRIIASGSKDSTIRLWDATRGRHLATLEGHEGDVLCVGFSRDGELLASGSSDRTVRIWDVQDVEAGEVGSRRLRWTLEGHAREVGTVAFSPDGHRVASGSSDRTLRVWDADTGMLVSAQDFNRGALRDLVFAPDGRHLVVAFSTGKVIVLDAVNFHPQAAFDGHDSDVLAVAVDAGSARVASGDLGGTIHVWSLVGGELLRTFQMDEGPVSSVHFRRGSPHLVSAARDGPIRIWDTETGEARSTLFGHEAGVEEVRYSPDGMSIASASHDGTVRIWDAETLAARVVLEGRQDGIRAIDVSSDGRLIASAGGDGTARLWDSTTGDLLATLKGNPRGLSSLAFSPSDRLIAAAAADEVILWSTETRQRVGLLEGHGDEVLTVAFRPDGSRLATGAASGVVRLWHVGARIVVTTLPRHEGAVRCVRYRPDGKRLASASSDGTTRVWDPETGRLVQTLRAGGGQILCLAYDPRGDRLATGSDDHIVRVWNPETGEGVAVLRGHRDVIQWLEFSPDGERLVSASRDGTLRFWNAQTYEQVELFDSGAGALSCFAFSPDGTRIFAGTDNQHIEVWETELASARALWHAAARRRKQEDARRGDSR